MTTTACSPLLTADPTATTRTALPPLGVGIEADGLVLSAGSRRLLDGVSVAIGAGELVAVIGASGAGKTTLLEALAGLRPPQRGSVRFTDARTDASMSAGLSAAVGYVPQDDIIHMELELDRTLLHAALLRLPATTTRSEASADVERVLDILDLRAVAGVRVGALSGGQRKRASIAVELLARPAVCFLDEPTSGLDPATGHALSCVLRTLADTGRTVIFTTHSTGDLEFCDRVLVMGKGGRLLFSGTVPAALQHFAVSSVAKIYEVIGRPASFAEVDHRVVPTDDRAPQATRALPRASRAASPLRQWSVLTVRAAHTLVRNRLTLAILLGSPALVTAMFVVLFRAGAFDPNDGDGTAEVMVTFWIAFAAFFFGLTYGLLQVCTEIPILRRERQAGLSIWAYVLSKIALLAPFLLVVDVVMLAVLRGLDRLPAAPSDVYGSLALTFFLDALAALCLGLVASAAVNSTAQAALALPMVCFPAVLFAGAMVPLHVMAGGGRAIAAFMADRWAFEALARDLRVGGPGSAEATASGAHPVSYYWFVLAGFIVVLLAAARIVVALRARPSAR